jgi:hypothetical protein
MNRPFPHAVQARKPLNQAKKNVESRATIKTRRRRRRRRRKKPEVGLEPTAT